MKSLLYILLPLLVVSQLVAQNTANIRGFVYNKANGEPVLFNNVYLKGTTLGASTDINGFFSITNIPAGTYDLLITSLDYDTLKETITVKVGEVINKKFYATKGGINLNEVEISAAQTEKVENTAVAVQKIDPVIITKLPSVGEPDLAQYLQVLPGVVFTGDQGGQLYIRGGLPIQNKVLLDGMIIYNPFHSIGLFSVFDSDIMKNANVYSAGFGAEYGGRVSSVMDITTRDGNKKRLSGKVAASTFGGKVLLEGPLKKLKEEGGGSSSFLLSAKQSYLPQSSKVLYSYVNKDGLPFSYTDLYGKVSFNANNGSKINFFGFNFSDKVDYKNLATFKWDSYGGGSNFILIPSSSNLLIEGVFTYSQYKISYEGAVPGDKKTSAISGFNGGFNFIKYYGRNELKYGFELIGTNTDYTLYNPNFSKIQYARSTTEVAGFMKFKYLSKNKKFILEPSFRLHYYASLNNISPEPRISSKFNVTDKIRLKGAAGMYSQSLISANSDRDVVNLFYGFVNAPEGLPDSYTNKDGEQVAISQQIQKAQHLVFGIEYDLTKHIEIQVEGYQKFFNQLTNVNRDKIFGDTQDNIDKPDALKKDFVIEQGRARGIDVTVKYEYKRFYLWTVYSLARNQRWVGNTSSGKVFEYAPIFDRRHNINVVGSYVFGKKRNLEVNVRWNFGSGFPFTQTQGFYPQLNFNNNFTYDYTTANANLGYVGAAFNQGRLPDYHRLDIGVKWKYNWTDRMILEISGGATNVYNRDNLFYFNRITYQRVDQLPILPNVNISLTF